MCSARWGSADYDGLLRDALESIAHQLVRDLERNERENNYITDETEKDLKAAVSELERCGISTGSASSKIEKLAWFVGGDPAKIRELQSKLNQLGVDEHLNEDGVYGKKTLAAWEKFISNLEHGTVPMLTWIDPLKNTSLPLEIGSSYSGINNTIRNAETHFQYFRVDPPHIKTNGAVQNGYYRGTRRPINYNHVNIDFGKNPTEFQAWLQKQYNHYPLDDNAYNAVKDLEGFGKKVRVAGKVLLVAGIALDALELGTTIEADLTDADRKLGKKTLSTAVGIGGSWAGAALGAKLGALAGAATGPASAHRDFGSEYCGRNRRRFGRGCPWEIHRRYYLYGGLSMGFVRLFELLFPPHRNFTPVPDDWPPDGSLRFIECGNVSWKAIPNTYRNYEFSPNEDAYDSRIAELGIEIMKRFCGSRQVLTKIKSVKKISKKGKFVPERFPVRYRRFLQQTQPQTPTYTENKKELSVWTHGFDQTAFIAFKELDRTDDCFFDFYVLPDALAASNAEDASKAVAVGKYDVWFSLSEWGPCALYITLNPETVDANTIQRIIESTCKEHQILFQNPPQS